MNPILHKLQNKQWIWSATSAKQQEQQQKPISTGFANFDEALNAGFPRAGMIHVQSKLGCGEFRLLLQIIQQQDSEQTHRFWVIVSPPGDVNAEFLLNHNVDLSRLLIIHKTSSEEALWATEQCVKSGACAGVFIWHKSLTQLQVRKLEIAAQQGKSYCIWFDNSKRKRVNLPLNLSLTLQRDGEDIELNINKQKHGWAQAPVKLPLPLHCRQRFRTKQRQPVVHADVVNLRAR